MAPPHLLLKRPRHGLRCALTGRTQRRARALSPGHRTRLRPSNPFFVLPLARPRDIIRAPVSVSVRGRDQRAWVEVDLAAVIENARTVARVAGTRLLPVVKADAYGVGAVAVSKALEALDPWGYGVATVEEGAELRAAGIARPVLVFTPARNGLFDGYREQRLTPALGDGRTVADWIAVARGGGHSTSRS